MVVLDPCELWESIDIDLWLGVTTSRMCLIIADIIVLSVTWRSMYGQSRFFNHAGQYRLRNQAPNLKIHPKAAGANARIEPAVDDGSNNFQVRLYTPSNCSKF